MGKAIMENTILSEKFISDSEEILANEFLQNGYVISDVADAQILDQLRLTVVRTAGEYLGISPLGNVDEFLNEINHIVTPEQINPFRLAMYRSLNGMAWFRPAYFKLGCHLVESLVGNELAMQNRINLSIQMPNDRTSLLDIHADVFSGETPYQVVQWLPLVNVSGTKSMYVLPRSKSEPVIARLHEFLDGGMSALYEEVKQDLIWLDVPYGKVVVFTPNILHGNVLNVEGTTRWSLNCRFTGLLTPYGSAEKSLGSFYLPITPRPVTKIGAEYQQPDGFKE
jgi:sporadic carbohydrate cluster 2OG-Fe(II) oxygenase